MTTPSCTIHSITLYPTPKPGMGCVVVATLAINVGPVVIPDVALLRMDNGRMQISLPRVAHGNRLTFRSKSDAQDLLDLAAEACRRIKGDREVQAE